MKFLLGCRATKFREALTEPVGDIFLLIIAIFLALQNHLATHLEMLLITNYFIKKITNYPFGDRAPEVTIETTDFSTKSIQW